MSVPESASGDAAKSARQDDLFYRAVGLPPAERNAFVASETADDLELRKELLDLIACDMAASRSTGPITKALGAAISATTLARCQSLVGEVINNYKLTSVIGQGGTGTVYLGERADRQYSAQVAVKIVEGATVPGSLGMRFGSERQILASLNHPNIARLLDAGETTDYRPFLIMEYVHGEPVDRFCDSNRFDLTARLELFVDICSAVQYAHQNLIVHRDLKPANILVTSEGVAKLLDFGIAKLLDVGTAASSVALTRMNDRLLTVEYASPEQILGRQVTTASDVYALGVCLYELLTGLRPYVVPASASQLELERLICVTDPQRPSQAVRRAMETERAEGQSDITAIAEARGLTADRLHRKLIGDLDAIVMRALRKEPQHRYTSVEQFAADVRRFLSREPVSARQGNWLYYSQRFVRRHALGVSAGASFIILILAFAITMSVQRQHIADERDRATQEGARAERVSEFMLEVFSAADPSENYGKEITARELLDQAARSIKTDLGEQPEVRAELLAAIGKAYRRQGQSEHAITFFQESVRVAEQAHLPREAKTGSVLTEMAVALRQVGRFEEANRALNDALVIARATESEQSLTRAQLFHNMGQLELSRGDLERADKYLAEALKTTRTVAGTRNPDVGAILIDISNVRSWRDDIDGAERAAREAVNIYATSVDRLHPDRVMGDYQLARVLNLQGKTDAASDLYQRTLDAQRALYGDASTKVGDTLTELASVRLAQNRLGEAEKLTRESLELSRKIRGREHHTSGYLLSALALVHWRQNKLKEAESELKESLEIFATTLPPDHQYVASAEYIMGEVMLASGHLHDAEAMLVASMERWQRIDAPAWRAARSASALGETLRRAGRTAEAEKYLLEGYQGLLAGNGVDAQTRMRARERIARFYVATDQRNKLNELQLATRHDATATAARPN